MKDSPDTLNRRNVVSAKTIGITKFTTNNMRESLSFFAEYGYVVYTDVYSNSLIDQINSFVFNYISSAEARLEALGHEVQTFFVSQSCMDKLQVQDIYNQLETSVKALDILEKYLGPDIAKIGWDQLWYNRPAETSAILVKNVHTDAWTGTSPNTVFWKVFISDVEFFNTLGVCPGSHLLGLVPVLNRAIDERLGSLDLKYISLDNVEKGDVVLWHPFLLHFSVGTGVNARYSITQRYTSLNTPFSTQEKGLGYKAICNGPLNYVMRTVGSDYASPYRTMGGVAAIDGRLSALYPCAPVKQDTAKLYRAIFEDL